MNAYTLILTLMLHGILADPPNGMLNVGTVLFTRGDVDKPRWRRSDVALLQARYFFETLIPPPNYINPNHDYVDKLLRYFRDAYSAIKTEATDPELDSILTTALSDTLGGYLKRWMLPVTKFAFYNGKVTNDNASKLFNFYVEVKKYLGTDGNAWRDPDQNTLRYIAVTVSKHQHTTFTRSMANACDNFAYYESTLDGLTIPMPYVDWNEKTMFIPVRQSPLVSLSSPKHSDVLLRYYETAKNCLLSRNPNGTLAFDERFQTWLSNDLVPHLIDDNLLYLAFGSVLSLVNNTSDLYNEAFDMFATKSNNIKRKYFLGISKNWSKKIMVVAVILFLEVIWCILAVRHVFKKKKKKSERSDIVLFFRSDHDNQNQSDQEMLWDATSKSTMKSKRFSVSEIYTSSYSSIPDEGVKLLKKTQTSKTDTPNEISKYSIGVDNHVEFRQTTRDAAVTPIHSMTVNVATGNSKDCLASSRVHSIGIPSTPKVESRFVSRSSKVKSTDRAVFRNVSSKGKYGSKDLDTVHTKGFTKPKAKEPLSKADSKNPAITESFLTKIEEVKIIDETSMFRSKSHSTKYLRSQCYGADNKKAVVCQPTKFLTLSQHDTAKSDHCCTENVPYYTKKELPCCNCQSCCKPHVECNCRPDKENGDLAVSFATTREVAPSKTITLYKKSEKSFAKTMSASQENTVHLGKTISEKQRNLNTLGIKPSYGCPCTCCLKDKECPLANSDVQKNSSKQVSSPEISCCCRSQHTGEPNTQIQEADNCAPSNETETAMTSKESETNDQILSTATPFPAQEKSWNAGKPYLEIKIDRPDAEISVGISGIGNNSTKCNESCRFSRKTIARKDNSQKPSRKSTAKKESSRCAVMKEQLRSTNLRETSQRNYSSKDTVERHDFMISRQTMQEVCPAVNRKSKIPKRALKEQGHEDIQLTPKKITPAYKTTDRGHHAFESALRPKEHETDSQLKQKEIARTMRKIALGTSAIPKVTPKKAGPIPKDASSPRLKSQIPQLKQRTVDDSCVSPKRARIKDDKLNATL